MPVIIDGHNLLWSIQDISGGPEAISDIQLCRVIGRYLKRIGEKGEIIFDGTGPADKSGFDNISNLEVFFSGLGVEADTVIADKIKANTSPRRLQVVSSDKEVRKAARARKAVSTKSDVFWENLKKQLSRKKARQEPPEKRTGLTEGETEQWLEFFGLEQ